MEGWREIAQSVIIGLIFAYLVAKLISIIAHFKDEQLHLTRSSIETPIVAEKEVVEEEEEEEEEKETTQVSNFGAPKPKASSSSSSSSEEEEDWEGVESTELDEAFSAATAFVAATAAEGRAKVGTDVQLQLYGLYKIATEGPCTTPQPSPLKMAARAKWNAWQKLGAMPPEEAMEKYIEIVMELYPSWAAGSSARNRGGTNKASSSAKGPMGPVFSSFIDAEEPTIDSKLDTAHISARDGCTDDLIKLIDGGIPIDLKDGEGRTPLHWAVDRGHYNIIELLVIRKADVNIKDNEGQTPLHYAALCERREIAELLIKHGAAVDAKDDDGKYPSDLSDSAWDFMTPTS